MPCLTNDGFLVQLAAVFASAQKCSVFVTVKRFETANSTCLVADVIVDASADACLSWLYMEHSRNRLIHFYNNGGLAHDVRELTRFCAVVNSTLDVTGLRKHKRDMSYQLLWKKDEQGNRYVLVCDPSDSSLRDSRNDKVKSSAASKWGTASAVPVSTKAARPLRINR